MTSLVIYYRCTGYVESNTLYSNTYQYNLRVFGKIKDSLHGRGTYIFVHPNWEKVVRKSLGLPSEWQMSSSGERIRLKNINVVMYFIGFV